MMGDDWHDICACEELDDEELDEDKPEVLLEELLESGLGSSPPHAAKTRHTTTVSASCFWKAKRRAIQNLLFDELRSALGRIAVN